MGEARRGLFVTFEGTEGSGKSTQKRLLCERLRAQGLAVVENQEPGGTAIGKQIRAILLDPENADMAPMTELLLMFASRAQAAKQVILPALQRGDVVVSDRYTDSTLAYQGEGRGIGFGAVRRAHELALGTLYPDLTLCITVDVPVGLQRAHQRNERSANGAKEARIDQQEMDFHCRVLQGYRRIAAEEPQRFKLVSGEGSVAEVAERVWSEVTALLRCSMRSSSC